MEDKSIVSDALALERMTSDPAFKKLWDEVRQGYIDGIVNCHPNQWDQAKTFKHRLDVLADVEKRFSQKISNGKIESAKRGLLNLFKN